jgi:hypothetical protein
MPSRTQRLSYTRTCIYTYMYYNITHTSLSAQTDLLVQECRQGRHVSPCAVVTHCLPHHSIWILHQQSARVVIPAHTHNVCQCYTCVHVCVCVYIYIYIYICIFGSSTNSLPELFSLRTQFVLVICMSAYICVTRTHTHTHTHTHIHTYTHTHTHMYIWILNQQSA